MYLLYSGQLFFVAVVVFAAAIFLPKRFRLLALLAFALAIFSAPPFPWWIAIPLLLAAVTPSVSEGSGRRRGALPSPPAAARRTTAQTLRTLRVTAAIVAIAFELPYHVRHPPVPRPSHVTVIGDSLASGGFGESASWPSLLGVPVTNLALASDTATGAVENQLPHAKAGTLLVEIGGNDMLDGTPARDFEAALERIVRSRERVIVLELPLLPGRWRYGAIQRRVAKEHGAVLVPKRILARVLAAEGNTSDGLHLTQRGHEALARELRAWLRW